MPTEATRLGIIGCGTISATYLRNQPHFAAFDVVAVADTRIEGARSRAAEFGIARAYTPDELLADPEIELVVNLTPHKVHAQVATSVLQAGKHVYTEKPLTVYREDAERELALASGRGLRVGGAPDTFFGGHWQTARQLIDEGAIGELIAASATLMARRPPGQDARWPTEYTSFYVSDYYDYGGGALFDRGPYYLNALIHLLGPVRCATGMAKVTWAERSDRMAGARVTVPTHAPGILEFANGVVCPLLMTNDVYDTGLPHVEIHGSEGSLRCIDPNYFGGPVLLKRPSSKEWESIEPRFGYNENSRGVGVADMAAAIRTGRPHRASGEMAAHVVDIINALYESSREGRHVDLRTTCTQPAPLPPGLADWTIDD